MCRESVNGSKWMNDRSEERHKFLIDTEALKKLFGVE